MNEEPLLIQEEQEPVPPQRKKKNKTEFVSSLFEIVEMFAWSVFAVLIIFTFAIRLCRVDGRSMENTLFNGETLLLYSMAYTPKQDDIVVFHLTDPDVDLEKTLVKRVIATGGQTVQIDFNTGIVLVDGVAYEDSHAVLKNRYSNMITGIYALTADHHYDADTNIFSATVPEGRVFVMGDNRNNSKDSRSLDIGFIDENCVLGKVVLRLFPLTVYD